MPIIIFLAMALDVHAQSGNPDPGGEAFLRRSLAISALPGWTGESGYEALPRIATESAMLTELGTAGKPGLAYAFAWDEVLPSAYSGSYYRYRGYTSIGFRVGAYLPLPGLRFLPSDSPDTCLVARVLAGADLARYAGASNLFIVPSISLSADMPLYRLGNRTATGLGLEAVLSFPGGAMSLGAGIYASIGLYGMQPGARPVVTVEDGAP